MIATDIEIRPAVPGDVARLSEIARAAKAHWGYPAEWMAIWAETLTITADLVREQPTFVFSVAPSGLGRAGRLPASTALRAVDLASSFVADAEQALIGFYVLEDLGERWSLAHLWVVPERHGVGVGRRLLEHALATVRTIRPGVLEIEADPHAASFYERCGARRVGAVPMPMPGAPSRVLPLLEMLASDA